MSNDKASKLEELVKKIYGDQINYYARGLNILEKEAINASIPAIVALTLPEHYASIVLTSRMDNELRTILERTLHRQGDVEDLLFEYNSPLGTFSAKINAAFSFGFLTDKMYKAITYCRKIRNAYAHADNPDDARVSKDYEKYASKLMALDAEYVADCIAKFNMLRDNSKDKVGDLPDFSKVVAVMLQVCEMLRTVAFYALVAKSEALRFPCAFLGMNDAPPYESMTKV